MNYVKYLQGLGMIGQVDPWKRDGGEPAIALLVSVEIALAECNGWSGQDITRSEFLAYLKSEDVLVFSNIDEFVNWKKEKGKPNGKKKFKRNISEERRNALKIHAEEMRAKIRPTISENA